MKYAWLNQESRNFLAQGYLSEGEKAEDRIEAIAYEANALLYSQLKQGQQIPTWLQTFRDDFLHGMERGWYSLSSPVWSNFGKDRGLPISCFGSYVPDSMDGILNTASEIGMMSKYGGGTSAYFGDVRPRGAPIQGGANGHSDGSVNFMRLFDTLSDVTKQGSVRRGSTAVYLPIDHDDIEEFLDIRDDGNPIQLLSFGVTISDSWMHSMIAGDMDKRRVWAKVLSRRSETGMPYIVFSDAANAEGPYSDSRYEILASNLCSEIMLPSNEDESFVCCLSSMNLAKWDEWKDTNAVEVLTYFLDAVMEEFIRKSADLPGLRRAHKFAKNHRALGLGALGWHSLLQQKFIPFGSLIANSLNNHIFRHINEATNRASNALAVAYGQAPVAAELKLGRRNTTLMAVAPTASSSFILGQVSPSIEPLHSNYHIKGLAKTTHVYRNPELEKFLEELGMNNAETWASILRNDGSVQHLDIPDDAKEVFKTFAEISQLDIIVQAATRQQWIDQGQSLNLMIHPDTPARDISQLYIEAWERGLKSLYYQHSINAAQEYNRDLLNCTACEA